jgi:hypothetical protein
MSTLIPGQEKGKSVDLREELVAADEEMARQVFKQAVDRLCRPASWHEVAGVLSGIFTVEKKDAGEPAEPGDHIRINIPGPGLREGDGDDWVRVKTIDRDFDELSDESFGLLLEVSTNPHSPNPAISHFFGEGASSSLLITRKGKLVTAFYKGRNETINTENLALTDKIRNIVVAGGAIAGISELQWSALLKGLLTPE